jgi:intracellular septation protein A
MMLTVLINVTDSCAQMKDELQKARTFLLVMVLVFTGAYIATSNKDFLQLLSTVLGAFVMSLHLGDKIQ